jgi:hypothetical protein
MGLILGFFGYGYGQSLFWGAGEDRQ